uniref:Egg protein CP391S-like n=1 Tax=Schistosoma mansoni TaxID=6183 RepID=A0AA82N8J9_SCHMA
MRYNFSPSLWMLIYLIFVWPYKLFNCNDICNNPDLGHHEIVIIENDTYRYSLHYKYSMTIQRNQSQPVSSERFKNKIDGVYRSDPEFSSSFYGSQIHEIAFNVHHHMLVFRGFQIGEIINYIENYEKTESRVLDEEELLGVKRDFLINVNGAEVTATMTSLIDSNGKVSLYYDNIPKEIEESQLKSGILGIISCENVVTNHEISVPAKWIKSGTLVVYEAIGKICSQYNTNETCQNATIPNLTCFWCEKKEKCIISSNQDTHDCRVEKTSDVNDLSTSTPIKDIETTLTSTEVQVSENLIETTDETDKHLKTSDVNDLSTSTPIKDIETTLTSTEVQVSENLIETTDETDKHFNRTTRTTGENKKHKSHWYLYVVISLVASLFLICVGCIIWRWLLRRKRSNE